MIVLGIDPGSVHVGWSLIRFRSSPSRSEYLASGEMSTEFERWAATVRMLERLSAVAQRVDLVAVERPDGMVFRPARGPHLLRTAWVGGEVLAWARASGYVTIAITPEMWKKALVGDARASDDEVERAVRVMVTGAETETNVHARDATGLAEVAGRMHARGYKPELRDLSVKSRMIGRARKGKART